MSEETMIEESIQKGINLLCETVEELIPVVLALKEKEYLKAGSATLSLYNNAADFIAFDYDALAEKWKVADDVDRALIKEAFAEAFKLPVGSEALEAKIEKVFNIATALYGVVKEAQEMAKL